MIRAHGMDPSETNPTARVGPRAAPTHHGLRPWGRQAVPWWPEPPGRRGALGGTCHLKSPGVCARGNLEETDLSPRKRSSNQHLSFLESNEVRNGKDRETTVFSSNEKANPQGDEILFPRSHPQLRTNSKDGPTFLT